MIMDFMGNGTMPKAKDLTGQRFGKLAAIRPTGEKSNTGSLYWLCQCDCGNTAIVTEGNLVSGLTKSCGCRRKELTKKMTHKIVNEMTIDGVTIPAATKKIAKNNATGVKGVSIRKQKDGSLKYLANITVAGKRHYLGIYDSLDEAIEARKSAEAELVNPAVEKYKK